MSKMKATTWVKLGSPNVWGVYLCVCVCVHVWEGGEGGTCGRLHE